MYAFHVICIYTLINLIGTQNLGSSGSEIPLGPWGNDKDSWERTSKTK